jgi:hypothetical protein
VRIFGSRLVRTLATEVVIGICAPLLFPNAG